MVRVASEVEGEGGIQLDLEADCEHSTPTFIVKLEAAQPPGAQTVGDFDDGPDGDHHHHDW